MPKVYVSIINYNGKDDTLSCLDSLNKVDTRGFKLEVVVIDNASSEIFLVNTELYNFSLKIIRSEKNLGFSGGQNLGIKYGLENEADYVFVLNNDVTLDKGLITGLLKAFEEKTCGLVSPKIYFAKGHEFHKDRYQKDDLGKVIWYAGGEMDWNNVIGKHRGVDEVDKGQYEALEKTDFVSGCAVLIKREVLEKVGLFDERYFLYYEDNNLSQRAKKAGFDSFYQPKAFLWHINAGSQGGSGSSLQDYYITRNRILFGFKYAPVRARLALIRESLKLLSSGRKWQKKGVRDFYLKKFGKGSYE